MNVSEIRAWLKEYQIEEQTYNCFRTVLNKYKNEEYAEYRTTFGEIEQADLVTEIQTVSVNYGNYPEFDYNHIVVMIPIRYHKKNIGQYKLYFTFDGKIDNDSFELF
ncbi:hypothetical protein E5161_10425 [Cohnella pontilimi]|uniref:DUF3887 domain-containing protein n=1 Tax=Cohnella pontilimi TaxID=2564100 RepID=A0A4U0FCD8_9BACL|nr:hypothetical protein [Cohnella pontilimi]TJY42400.1 hypothetical protein E5161_10425 [Cohnella pontilimi]